jgi:glutaredoxin 3
MATVIMYTTDACSKCSGAKALLTKRGIVFEEVNLSRDPDSRARLMQRTGMWTFPQILVDDEPIGGFDELRRADQAGLLRDLAA